MEKIALHDILNPSEYEKTRDQYRQRIIELKRKRRVSVGDRVSMVFENRDTVQFQIQEMVRAEKITDPTKIQEEIDVYNSLIPDQGELSATVFLEIEHQGRLREELLRFLGFDERVFLKIGEQHSVHGCFEQGHSKEDKISAVQYVRFPMTADQVRAFTEGSLRARIVFDHPNYRAEAEIGPETRHSLNEDLKA